MARDRDPRRDQAFEIWKSSGGSKKLTEIAEELHISSGTVRGWKNKDSWDEKINGTFQKKTRNAPKASERSKPKNKGGAPKGNKNALGNRGGGAPLGNQNGKGHGPPKGNSNAVKTGLYRNYFNDVFTQEELDMLDGIETDPLVQISNTISLLTLRELAIMKQIRAIEKGLTSVQKIQIQQRRSVKEKKEIQSPESGKKKVIETDTFQMVPVQIEEQEESQIETLLKLEDALTKVQKEKIKASKIYHDISMKFETEKEQRERKLIIEEEKWSKEKGEGDKKTQDTEEWVSALQKVAEKRRKATK
jgi:uncharacterized protein YjcR